MANRLTVVAGPPGGGESRWIRQRMEQDLSLILIDYTALFVALTGQRRDEDGRFPIRVSGDPRNRAHARAREEAIPYQTLPSSVIHKYLAGRLTEKR